MKSGNTEPQLPTIRPIRTEADYRWAHAEVGKLLALDAEGMLSQTDEDRLDILSTLIEAYEKEQHPVYPPHPADAIRFRMDQMGLKQKDLAPYMHGESRVSEVLAGKKPLTLEMVRNLHRNLGIPLASLVAA